ncbi:MAG: DHHA1 domain-containing protein [Oscillospiraceae bacterium]
MKQLNQTLEKFQAREAAERGRAVPLRRPRGGRAEGAHRHRARCRRRPPAEDGRLPPGQGPGVVAVLAAVSGDKITFLAVCGKEAVKAGVKAGDIIKQVSAIAGGSGGGKPDSAMGGGKDPLMLDNALAMVDNVVSMKLGL